MAELTDFQKKALASAAARYRQAKAEGAYSTPLLKKQPNLTGF